jgi:alpha(1,3/1,4) fucosyltransferase
MLESALRVQTVRIQCAKFWAPQVTAAHVFAGMPYIAEHFDFVSVGEPDFLLFSVFPGELPPARATRIFYTAENVRPDFAACDWALSFEYDEELRHRRHLRLPNYVRLGAGADLLHRRDPADVLAGKSRFCNFIYHRETPERTRFFELLSKYKRVDAPGRSHNNMAAIGGHLSADASRFAAGYHGQKVEFQRPYKFTIAFENASYPGYTTEKLYHAMVAETLPVYWGNPLVHRDFNTASFLNAADFESLDNLADAVVDLDRNDDLYLSYLSQPWYPDGRLTPYVDPAVIVAHFKRMFEK